MTQPQQPTPDTSNTGQLLAATALGLALLAIEARIREEADDTLTTAITAIAATLVISVAATLLTGTALLSLATVHTRIKTELDQASTSTNTAIRAAYAAGAQLALTKTQRELTALGHETPSTLPDLGNTVNTLANDTTLAYNQALADIQNTVRDAFDGITGTNNTDVLAARKLAVAQAARTAGARLRVRIQAAAANAVYEGANDALNAIFADFNTINPYIGLRKRWRTTAIDPCAMCRDLDGTTVAIGAEFDHTAGQDTTDYRPVWRTLQGPPRHPNCRCQLELVTN